VHLWRISEHLELDGYGGYLYPGRWNGGGIHVIYTAEHSSLALLEVLVQFELAELPPPYQLLQIQASDQLETRSFAGALPAIAESRAWGDAWLRAGETAVAQVPAAVAPEAYNILINHAHADAAGIRLIRNARYGWDPRLFG
jgi:RES domain-containing protein